VAKVDLLVDRAGLVALAAVPAAEAAVVADAVVEAEAAALAEAAAQGSDTTLPSASRYSTCSTMLMFRLRMGF
jgi:hypothetical protein